MRTSLKTLVLAGVAFFGILKGVQASQEIYLSESPDARYRVIVHQEIFRQVGEKAFFRYPITVLNLRNRHRLHVFDASVPFIEETLKGTFKVDWDFIHFDWSKNSRIFFMRLQTMRGVWKTFFVDLGNGTARDVTDELREGILNRLHTRSWACEWSKITLDHWFNPTIAVFQVTTDCGKDKDKENNKLFRVTDFVVFDAKKQKVAKQCLDCDLQKAEKTAWKYFQTTQVTPTPTPVPEETPGVSQ